MPILSCRRFEARLWLGTTLQVMADNRPRGDARSSPDTRRVCVISGKNLQFTLASIVNDH